MMTRFSLHHSTRFLRHRVSLHRSSRHYERFAVLGCAVIFIASLTVVSGCEPRGMDAQAAMEAEDTQRVSYLVDDVGKALTPYVKNRMEKLRTLSVLEERLSNDSLLLDIPAENVRALQQLYSTRAYAPIFVRNGKLTEAGVAVSETLLTADGHGFDPAEFHAARIHEEISSLAMYNAPSRIHGALELLPQDRDALMQKVQEQLTEDERLPSKASMLESIVDGGNASPVPELTALIRGRIAEVEPLADIAGDLELLLADGFLRWSIAQRFGNLRYITTDIANARGWRIIVYGDVYSTRQPGSPYSEPMPDPDQLTDISDKEVALTLATEYFERALKDGDFERALREIAPPFKDYSDLVRAAKKYRAIALTGGWNTLEDTDELAVGDHGPGVAALKARLATEGYFDGDIRDESFDSALRTALLTYQETHQLRGTATLSDETLTSLNVPAVERLAQIHVVLDRWRHTRIGEDVEDQYIIVNVPDFHVELWSKGERVHRMRAVVGATRHWRNEHGEMQVDGRTPLFSDVMQYIVFNPFWNVPNSLARGYEREMEENPDWLEENGFEYIPTDEGGQLLRQLPGPNNALGLVKFLFPNEHDVYLHDTNQRNLFQHAFRNYSYGCVRVEDALDFAGLLISRDKNISRSAGARFVQQKLEAGEDQWVGMHTPVPIHIEYYSVRLDDDGHTNFLADFHRRDQAAVEARTAWLEEHLQHHHAESAQLLHSPEFVHAQH